MQFVKHRALRLIPVLFIVSFFSFLLLDLLPGDPASQQLGQNATTQRIERLHRKLSLDQPLPARYLQWIGHAATGDLGRSEITGQPVGDTLRKRAGVTIELLVSSQLLALGLSVPAALLSARRPGGLFDRLATGVGFAFMAVPAFILAVLLVLVFAVNLGWLPATGLPAFSEAPIDHVRSMVLPSFCLAMSSFATYLRVLRTELITTLQEDFILTARAKGLPTWWILLRHTLRPSSASLLTVAGLVTGALIGGTVIIEVIFVLPGMGALAVEAIRSRDYTVVQGVVFVVSTGYILVNFLVDALYATIDPRIRDASAVS
jgi:peptide/nickel transport system permease protein